MHAFQLLEGIGKSKALSMVEIRGRVGWDSLLHWMKPARLMPLTFLQIVCVRKSSDPHMTPNLLDLLIRA